MRILITGASGMLGGRLCELLSRTHEILGTSRTGGAPAALETRALDLCDAGSIRKLMGDFRPDGVIHCAALADVDACEREPARAVRDNVDATAVVARESAAVEAALIMMSTDLVFDGSASWRTESSPTWPLSVYGHSKLDAERIALASNPRAIVFRLALLGGRGHGGRVSATEAVARRLWRGEHVTLFEDEWRTPTDASSVALAAEAALTRTVAGRVFHIGGAERLTRFEIGERVARVLDLDASLLRKASRATHRGAPRARDVSLDATLARQELGFEPRPLDHAIQEGRLLED